MANRQQSVGPNFRFSPHLPPLRLHVAKLHRRGSSSLCKLVSQFIADSGLRTTDCGPRTRDFVLQTSDLGAQEHTDAAPPAIKVHFQPASEKPKLRRWRRQRSLLKISICCHCVQQFAIVKLCLMINVCGGHIKLKSSAVCPGHLRDLCDHEWHQCLRSAQIQLQTIPFHSL